MFLAALGSAIYGSNAYSEFEQKECNGMMLSALEQAPSVASRSMSIPATSTQMATVKHIVAIFIHIVASELVLQFRFWHEFVHAYSLPRYAS